MKILILACCCFCLSLALPQGGYNYQQNGNAQLLTSNTITTGSIIGSEGGRSSVSILNNLGFPSPSPVNPSGQSSFITSSLPQTVYHHQQQRQQQAQHPITPIITKNFYVHAAPEDESEDEDLARQLSAGPVRKHYRILFIKAPSQSHSAATALRLAQSKSEDRTVIYVLSKKTDLSDLQSQLAETEAQSVKSKPEVYFIKYKTQDEARHAQQQIQAQYDALGGTSQVTDEGYAPVSSVIGALDNKPSPFVVSSPSTTYTQSNAAYLPPNRF